MLARRAAARPVLVSPARLKQPGDRVEDGTGTGTWGSCDHKGVSAGMEDIRPWLEALVAANGSDLHMKAGSPPRIRVDGRLSGLDAPPLDTAMLNGVVEAIVRPDLAEEFKR